MKKKFKKVNAAILIIGNEILSGRTQDKNVIFISNWLNSECGISVGEGRRYFICNIDRMWHGISFVFNG